MERQGDKIPRLYESNNPSRHKHSWSNCPIAKFIQIAGRKNCLNTSENIIINQKLFFCHDKFQRNLLCQKGSRIADKLGPFSFFPGYKMAEEWNILMVLHEVTKFVFRIQKFLIFIFSSFHSFLKFFNVL